MNATKAMETWAAPVRNVYARLLLSLAMLQDAESFFKCCIGHEATASCMTHAIRGGRGVPVVHPKLVPPWAM